MEMHAAVYHGPGDVRIERLPVPAPDAGQIRVAVDWCGVCGSDVAEYLHGPLATPGESPHPITGSTLPVVLGHEFAGRVDAVGQGVSTLHVGDPVAVNPVLSCGICPQCLERRPNLCVHVGFHGVSGGGGGLAEYTVVSENALHLLPSSVPTRMGALVEPCAVAYRAMRRSGVRRNDPVLIVGAGPVGLAIIACLKGEGIDDITVVERSPARRQLASEMGAARVHAEADTRSPHASEQYKICFEATGSSDGLERAIEQTGNGGTLLYLARFKHGERVDPNRLRREINFVSSYANVDEFERVVALMAAGTLDPTPMVTSAIGLKDFVELGLKRLSTTPVMEGKVLVALAPGLLQ